MKLLAGKMSSAALPSVKMETQVKPGTPVATRYVGMILLSHQLYHADSRIRPKQIYEGARPYTIFLVIQTDNLRRPI